MGQVVRTRRALLGALLTLACGGDRTAGPGTSVDAGQDVRVAGAGGSGGAGGSSSRSDAATDPASPTGADTVAVDSAVPGSGGAGGADAAPAGEAGAGCAACTSWGSPEPGRITAPGLGNLSGMAASWRNPGLLFVHNDRDVPRFYAVDEAGMLRGTFTLGGATVSDIEDMAVSRCPAGTCVYVADIGNNVNPRSVFAIYRAAEPQIAGADRPTATLPAERFAFSYADGAHNAESLVVDPGSGAVYVITKVAAGMRSAAYRLETFETGRTNQAVKVADLPVPASDDQPAVAASAHPCGLGFLLRTGNRLYEFRAPVGAPFADAFKATPAAVPAGQETQSEAVSYGPDGRSYYTTGEGASPALFRTRCAPGS